MSNPHYPSSDYRIRETLITLENANKFPGRILPLPIEADISTTSSFALIASARLQKNDTFFSPNQAWVAYLMSHGLQHTEPQDAQYHFYLSYQDDNLEHLKQADFSKVQIFISAKFHTGQMIEIRTSGVQGINRIAIDTLSPKFFLLCQTRSQLNQLWNITLVDRNQILGLSMPAKLRML